MRILVIHNPASGKGGRRLLTDVLARLEAAGGHVEVRDTRAAGEAAAFARDAGRDYDRLVIAGGDGTINEVLNGLKTLEAPPDLALVPVGTANVLAAEIGLPACAQTVAATILGDSLRPIDLGEAGGRRFVLMAGVGFDAHVVAGVSVRLKAVVGKGAYLWSAIRSLIRFGRPDYPVTVDGETFHAASVIVTKGRFYAGRYIMAPDAGLGSGQFQVCLFQRGGALAILGYGLRLLRNRLDSAPHYRILPARRIEVRGPAGEPVQLDGDVAGTLPLSIRIVPNALRLAFPTLHREPGDAQLGPSA